MLLLNNEILQNIEHVPSFINYMYFDSFWQRSARFFTARLRCDLQIHDLLKQWRLVILILWQDLMADFEEPEVEEASQDHRNFGTCFTISGVLASTVEWF